MCPDRSGPAKTPAWEHFNRLMSWRRIAPWTLVALALCAIWIDLPRQTLNLEALPANFLGREVKTVLGLDLEGGIRVTLAATPTEGQQITPEDVENARDIIERRVSGLGVSEPQVRTETSQTGERRIVVEVPGVTNEDQVRRLVGSTGRLQFIDPMGQQLAPEQDITEMLDAGIVRELFHGGEIENGSVTPDSDQGGQLGVSFRLSERASATWCQFTTTNVNNPGPIALDGVVFTTPNIGSAICQGETIITVGSGEAAEAERTELYNTIRYGALPVALTEQSVEEVAPTLGRDFLVQSLIAGGIGILLVLFFMVYLYRLPGALAAIALIFYALVVYAIFRLIPVTLTLAGVAAFILSIGMAVDANILIFERMKEEIRLGKSLGPAIEAGFNRAWSSILDSNVSSLLVAGWLYWQGTSVVRGFALVLAIGVVVSMLSAIVVTRTILRYVVRTRFGRRIELYHVER